MLWVLDIDDLQMPYKGAYTPNWLDRLAVAMAVKPIIVLPTLLAAIADIGMEVDEEVVSAAASHHQQPPGHERSTEHTSASSAAPGNAHTARAGENQAVVVFSGDSCAKDALSELEHGGTATTLENFTHEFKSESKQQFAKHYAARTHSVYSGSGEVATARVNAATTQSNQVELALRSALQAQEVDGRVHYFVAVDESLTVVSGDGGAGGGVCKYSASCLAELIRDKSNRAGLPSHRQNVRELHHAVLLQDDSADHCHFALQCTPAVDIPAKPLEVVAVEVLNQQCILLPHEESHSTALTLRLPVMLGRPCTKQYVELLQYCYFMVASVPINCPAPLVQIVNRVRWLLVLFHVSLQCKLAAMVTTTSSTSSIAMDTLLQALVSVDTVLTRAYHYTPNEEFLRPAEKVVFTHSEASSHGASTVASRRSSSVNTVQNTAATNTAAATEKPDRAHRNGVRHFRAVAWTLDMLSVEIVDCLYAQLVSSFRLKDIIRSVYLCYFTPGSMNPAAEYLIKGKVVLPHDLSRGAADRFFRDLRTYCDEESSFVELSDSTNGEASAATLKALWYGVDHIIDVYNNAHEARASKLVMHPRNVRLNLQALYRDDTMSRVRRNLQRILDHLPSIIDLTTPEITAQMNDHKKNIGGKTASASGSSASASGNAPGGSGHRPTAPPVAAAATVSDYSARRRRGERIMITFDTREFDPLWAFLLAEATAFNRMLTELRRNIEDLLTCTVDISLLQYFTQCGIAITEGSSDAARIATILQALHDGNAPSTLTSVAFSAREAVHGLKLEDWWKEISDQQHLLMEWLSSGHPPKIRMHLLRNPAGLLYALKETFCMRTDATLDKVHFFYRVQAEESAAQVDVQTISKTNNGCSVILSDLYLHNALFHEKSSMLEFLPEHSASAFGKVKTIFILSRH